MKNAPSNMLITDASHHLRHLAKPEAIGNGMWGGYSPF